MGALSLYGAALRVPGIPRVVIALFACRLLAGMVSLALLLAAEDVIGGFAGAGLVAGAYAVALTFTAPVWGHVTDARGLRRSLLVATVLQALAFTVFLLVAAGEPHPALLAAAAFTVGACTPPSGAVSNSVFTGYVTGEQERKTLLALSGLLTESVFILGPLIVAGAVLLFSPLAAVLATAVISTAGALWLAGAAAVAAADRERAERPSHPDRDRFVWPPGQLRILTAIALGAVAIGAVQVTSVAHADGIGTSAGLLLAVTACGGVLGSLLYGGLRLPGSQTTHLVIALAGYGLAIATLGPEPGLALSLVLLFVIGFANGPADGIEAALVSDRATPETRARAFGLLVSANWIGFAAGSALTGYVVEHTATGSGAIVGAVAALAAVVALLERPRPARTRATGDLPSDKGAEHADS
ncbi:MFS transporter [Streptomyces sp. NPDC020875]|uniref:MFS transporter n=1 Tax=Streptomyces sp. NPDC020875 TaxID=3154898 RepID=UPI0033E88AB9